MATEPAQINLDDIWAALPLGNSTSVVVETRRDSYHQRTESVPSHDSHHSMASHPVSHVSSHQQQHQITDVFIPPEPKSRATTLQSAASHATASTVKHEPQHIPVSHAMVVPNEPAHPLSDNLMESIFGAESRPEAHHSNSLASSHHAPQHHHSDDAHHHAIQHIDDVLAAEDTDGQDAYSIVSERSYKGSSHHSHKPAHLVADEVVNSSFNALNLNGGHNGYHHSDSEYLEEQHDQFEQAHLPYAHKGHRTRTMTMDSLASVAETRYGGFDVHDDHGHYTSQDIDLHHNEVAYNRPKKVPVKSSPVLHAPAPIRTGDTVKLQQLNREVADAHRKEAQLTAQVERLQADNERRRQQNLAKEAQLKVSQISTSRPYQAYNKSNSSVTSQSSTGHVSSSHQTGSAVYSTTVHSSQQSRPNGHPQSRSSSVTTTTVTPANLVSQTSIYEEEPVTVSDIARHQLSHGQKLGRIGKIELVVPQMEGVQGFSTNQQIHKVVIGGHSLPTEDDKCVLLFGPVGSGKTSSISSMLNYLYDVKKENEFRFVLESDHKRTTGLTAYVINNSILPFSITIVDTPGVIDDKNNKTVSTLIKQWFEQELLDAGAFRIDAISIVLRHDEDNLGWPFIYELAAVKRMFGDDLKTNVLPIVTHTEVLPQPLAIRSLALANISFVEYYKLNNVGFAPEARGITKLQHNLYFTHGLASLESYFRDLQELIHPLLAVLRSPAGLRSAQAHSYDGTALY